MVIGPLGRVCVGFRGEKDSAQIRGNGEVQLLAFVLSGIARTVACARQDARVRNVLRVSRELKGPIQKV